MVYWLHFDRLACGRSELLVNYLPHLCRESVVTIVGCIFGDLLVLLEAEDEADLARGIEIWPT